MGRRALPSDEELLQVIDRDLEWFIYNRADAGPGMPDADAMAFFEEVAIQAARDGAPARLGELLARGELGPAGVQVAAEVLMSIKPKKKRGRPHQDFMGRFDRNPTLRAATELPDIVEILKRRYPDLRTGYRELAIHLAALRNGANVDTLRNHLKRGRRRGGRA
jgi:hypothetical protein